MTLPVVPKLVALASLAGTGALNENTDTKVLRPLPAVITAAKSSPAPPPSLQAVDVSETHSVDIDGDPPTRMLLVDWIVPKSSPARIRLVPPVEGALTFRNFWKKGVSKLKNRVAVPALRVIDGVPLARTATPAGDLDRIAVSVIHRTAQEAVFPSLDFGDSSNTARFAPLRVKLLAPVAGTLVLNVVLTDPAQNVT